MQHIFVNNTILVIPDPIWLNCTVIKANIILINANIISICVILNSDTYPDLRYI